MAVVLSIAHGHDPSYPFKKTGAAEVPVITGGRRAGYSLPAVKKVREPSGTRRFGFERAYRSASKGQVIAGFPGKAIASSPPAAPRCCADGNRPRATLGWDAARPRTDRLARRLLPERARSLRGWPHGSHHAGTSRRRKNAPAMAAGLAQGSRAAWSRADLVDCDAQNLSDRAIGQTPHTSAGD